MSRLRFGSGIKFLLEPDTVKNVFGFVILTRLAQLQGMAHFGEKWANI